MAEQLLAQYSIAERRLKQQDVLERLMRPLRERNPQAYYHSQMVAGYASWMAELLYMDPSMSQGVYIGGLLHDIGKGDERYVLLLSGNSNRDNNHQDIYDAHAANGHAIITDEMHPEDFGDDPELVDLCRFVAANHHVGSSKASRYLIKNENVRRNYPHITDWGKLSDVLTVVRIADSFDSRTNTAGIKIPPRPAFLPQSICRATEAMVGEFEDPDVADCGKYDRAFLPAFIELTNQMKKYSQIMGIRHQ